MSETMIVYLYNLLTQTAQNGDSPGFWDWYARLADSIGILTFILGAILAWRAKNELQKLRELINRVNLVQDIAVTKQILLDIQGLHTDANEINLRRAIDRYSQVREQLLRIKEHTEGLTRDQEKAFLKVLAELGAMQQAATGIMITRDTSHGGWMRLRSVHLMSRPIIASWLHLAKSWRKYWRILGKVWVPSYGKQGKEATAYQAAN